MTIDKLKQDGVRYKALREEYNKVNKFKYVASIDRKVYFPNIEDWKANFWKRNYLIAVTSMGIEFAVNAECEQDAIDYIIDYCEDHMPGLILDKEDEVELEKDGHLEDYISGGNHCRHLSTFNVYIKEIFHDDNEK